MGATAKYESPVVQSSYRSNAAPATIRPASNSVVSRASAPSRSIADSSQYESAKPAVEATPSVDADAALLTVAVPSEAATVTVNGHSTKSSGTLRQFMSRGLKEGYVYTYVVKVDYEMDGKFITDSQEVKLRPGNTEQLVFEAKEAEAEATPAEPVAEVTKTEEPAKLITIVKLHVPADAQVNLAGNDTNGSGAVRTFRTSHLKPGEQWKNYTVRVTAMIDGQPVTEERTIDVIAGTTNEINFEFASDAVAQR